MEKILVGDSVLNFSQMRKIISKHNEENDIKSQGMDRSPLLFNIVYKESNWNVKYNETQRTYQIRSDEKYFLPLCGTSLYGDCLDGKDLGVRLDLYNWDIEKIYQVK